MQGSFPYCFSCSPAQGLQSCSMSARQEPHLHPQLCSSLGNLLFFRVHVPQTKLPLPNNALDHSGCKEKPSENIPKCAIVHKNAKTITSRLGNCLVSVTGHLAKTFIEIAIHILLKQENTVRGKTQYNKRNSISCCSELITHLHS